MHLAHLIHGDEGEYVLLLQRFLVLNGVLHRDTAGRDPVNGRFDDTTKTAVEEFQRKSSLDVSGKVGGMTWAAIAGVARPLRVDEASPPSPYLPALKYSNEGSLVTALQKLLLEYQQSFSNTPPFVTPGIFNQAEIEAASGFFW